MKPQPKPPPKPKKAAHPKIDKKAILFRRYSETPRPPECTCGCGRDGHDLHHAFIGRKKGYPILDDERNLILVNHLEHISRKFDVMIWRIFFWDVQVKRYGKKKMLEWIDAVLAAGLDRSRLDFLNE